MCKGKDDGTFAWGQEAYGKNIDVAYYRQMASVPGVEVNVVVRDDDHALLFRSDIGGEGTVMPLVKAPK